MNKESSVHATVPISHEPVKSQQYNYRRFTRGKLCWITLNAAGFHEKGSCAILSLCRSQLNEPHDSYSLRSRIGHLRIGWCVSAHYSHLISTSSKPEPEVLRWNKSFYLSCHATTWDQVVHWHSYTSNLCSKREDSSRKRVHLSSRGARHHTNMHWCRSLVRCKCCLEMAESL
jgi:hypothetical protein